MTERNCYNPDKKTQKGRLTMEKTDVKQKKHIGLYFKRYWMVYAMLIPGLVYIIVFKYIPMYGVAMAFKDYKGIGNIADAAWVGMQNFVKLFSTNAFVRSVKNTIIISLGKLVVGFPMPIILSLLIDNVQHKKVKKLAQTAVILPSFISWVVVYGLLYAMLSPNSGAVQGVLEFFGYEGKIPDFLSTKEHFRTVIIASYVWKQGGVATVVYLAAITGVDQDLYEAAAIDGAGRWRQIWHVTLASIRTTILTMFILRVGDIMVAGFDQIYTMSNNAVISVADIIDTYVYRVGLSQRKFSLATAAGLFQSAIGLVMVLITNHIAKKVDPESGIV